MRRTEKICYALAVLSLLLGLLLRFVFTSVRFTGLLLCCGAAALMEPGLSFPVSAGCGIRVFCGDGGPGDFLGTDG